MGRIFGIKTKNGEVTTFAEALILAVGVIVILGCIYWFAPGLRVDKSKVGAGLELSKDKLDNVTTSAKLPLPSRGSAKYETVDGHIVPTDWDETASTKVADKPLIRIAEYAWNCNSGMIAANGGPRTTEGSLNEASGLNLEIVRLDGVSDLRNMQLKFVEEFANGVENPKSEKSAFAVSIMGDGVPFYIATTQQALNDKFGEGKYHVQAIGAIGMSDGEDKVIGPAAWKANPQLMRGCLISSVVGDGDWVVAVNFAFANNIPVNPDVKTYDPNAVNFTPSENDDYINSVKELIKSQTTGYTVPLKEVKDGKLTGKTVNIKINGATTWTPGDKLAFDALSGYTDIISTKEFTNQMATTIVVVKEWAMQHDKEIIALLKNSYTACNQIKQYNDWSVFASKAVCKTYNLESPQYWFEMFKGITKTKDGVEYHIGGSRVLNYADAMQYYGITDGTNRYKTVYEQISKYLVDLNPCGFNESVTVGIIPYDEAVNLYFLKSINDVDAGVATKADYSKDKTTTIAKGEWHINFVTGSAEISGSTRDLDVIYGLLIQAEETKVKIVGFTDNVGNANSNIVLSKERANSVKQYLINKGIPESRFQLVDGLGDTNPVATNVTGEGRAKNRRCEITILK
jgi:OmpA-OmpF porin, OOP family